eukprot:Hpha_TRINITY_DN16595_c0_g2::TRINITY_DN16595_c0_g2_i1::g.132686::m.132686
MAAARVEDDADVHARIARTMAAALAPVKVCKAEKEHEIEARTDWAGVLNPPAWVPTEVRTLETKAARERYTPDQLLVVLDSLLDDGECARLNEVAEAIGFGRTSYPQQYRGNLRLIVTDPGLSRALWERVRPHVPERLVTKEYGREAVWRAVGLNECFRLAKYYEGHRFGAHCDARFERTDDEKSFFTVNVYTNSVKPENGGRTRFYLNKKRENRDRQARRKGTGREEPTDEDFDLQLQPEAGTACLFQHGPGQELLHDGERLRGGVKYLLRSDVMYRRMEDDEDSVDKDVDEDLR